MQQDVTASPGPYMSFSSLVPLSRFNRRGNQEEKCKEIAIIRDRENPIGGIGNLSEGQRTKLIHTIIVSAS